MLLLIDAGNTRIKWALAAADAAPGDWLSFGSMTHADLGPFLPSASTAPVSSITRVLVSNVAGDAFATRLSAVLQDMGVSPSALTVFRAQPECAGVRNGYAQPAQLGSDRFASLIGARHRFPNQRLLVVTCGTATTIDALEADGRFIGGMIVPGLGTMAESLALSTALLPSVNEAVRERMFADNTREAIVSGCLTAQVGAILHAMSQRQDPVARCVLSGGAAPYIGPHLPISFDAVDNLVLLGLHASAASAAFVASVAGAS